MHCFARPRKDERIEKMKKQLEELEEYKREQAECPWGF